MMQNVIQMLTRTIFLLSLIALVTARPQHLTDSNQELTKEDIILLEDPVRMAYVKMELERMLAVNGLDELRMDRPMKRQTNRLKCYFNPIPNDQENTILGSSGLSDVQLELLAQRLAEYNNQIPSAWDRILRLPERPWERIPEKRQSRFRQCYFNPVSCFKK